LTARDFATKKQNEIASELSLLEEAEDFLLKYQTIVRDYCDFIDQLIIETSNILENSELPQEEKTKQQDDDKITKLTSKLVAQLLSNDDFKNLMLELSK
jgi:hypothetical protein